MPSPLVLPIDWLNGRRATDWFGTEMAVAGGAPLLADVTAVGAQWDTTPPIWRAVEVPFAQFTSLEIALSDGTVVQLLSQCEDGTGFHGLHLRRIESDLPTEPPVQEAGSIYRFVRIVDGPTDALKVSVLRKDRAGGVIEVEISDGQAALKLLSAEIYDRSDVRYEIYELDESILVQVDGNAAATEPRGA